MKILHICAGWERWNGAANIARMIAKEQEAAGNEVTLASWAKVRELREADEVWVHCGWLPCLWWAALWGRNVHWMPEACYDPVRLGFHGWKKWLVGPIERWCLRRCDRIVATCEAEKGWIEAYLGKRCPEVEVTDVKRFFVLGREFGSDGKLEAWRRGFQPRQLGDLTANSEATLTRLEAASPNGDWNSLHILYLGRRHPLKGVEYLEKAVRQIQNTSALSASPRLCVKFVSNAFGEEKEKVWDWCDVLVLPTLSDNFGLVIAEALERGKRVITTDGAPAWEVKSGGVVSGGVEELGEISGGVGSGGVEESGVKSGYGGRLIYLKGYRDGTDGTRVELLKRAIEFERDSFLKCD